MFTQWTADLLSVLMRFCLSEGPQSSRGRQ